MDYGIPDLINSRMKLDAFINPQTLDEVPAFARSAEAVGFDALWTSEVQHDPFLPGALIAEHTRRLHFGTAVAIAFARSPATLAYTAWDLARASGGRFILGLGTQIKAHIERRFGMPWPDSPVRKLNEQINALRAFWRSWQTGELLKFHGEFYKLTLMPPFFNPGPIGHPHIPIYIAGVNSGLARLAGEVGNGFQVHPFHTPQYLRHVLIPALEDGASKAGRQRTDISVCVTAFTASTADERHFARTQIAFYASTPSYRPVMAFHGWEAAARKLSSLALHNHWEEMADLIDDQMLSTLAVLAGSDELPKCLVERYQDLADRLMVYQPFIPGDRDEFWKGLTRNMQDSES